MRNENDNQTIGLLICKTKDNVLAKYAVNAVNVPIGISEYDMNNLIPEDYRSSEPAIEEKVQNKYSILFCTFFFGSDIIVEDKRNNNDR